MWFFKTLFSLLVFTSNPYFHPLLGMFLKKGNVIDQTPDIFLYVKSQKAFYLIYALAYAFIQRTLH